MQRNFLAALAVSTLLAACGGESNTPPSEAGDAELQVPVLAERHDHQAELEVHEFRVPYGDPSLLVSVVWTADAVRTYGVDGEVSYEPLQPFVLPETAKKISLSVECRREREPRRLAYKPAHPWIDLDAWSRSTPIGWSVDLRSTKDSYFEGEVAREGLTLFPPDVTEETFTCDVLVRALCVDDAQEDVRYQKAICWYHFDSMTGERRGSFDISINGVSYAPDRIRVQHEYGGWELAPGKRTVEQFRVRLVIDDTIAIR